MKRGALTASLSIGDSTIYEPFAALDLYGLISLNFFHLFAQLGEWQIERMGDLLEDIDGGHAGSVL